MKEYNENELREMISNLRVVKVFAENLTDEGEVDLITYELLLENHLNNKYKDIDEWLNKNGFNKIVLTGAPVNRGTSNDVSVQIAK